MALPLVAVLCAPALAADNLAEALKASPVFPNESTSRFQQAVLDRIPELKLAKSADAWRAEAEQIRQRVLDEVVFRGVPQSWRSDERRVEFTETIDKGLYRVRKLRFEALPGLWIPAALYEPAKLNGKAPVVLNVNGHSRDGKVTDYKQLRCIQQAKQGMIALNVEWVGMGQLRDAGYSHNNLGMLDLCGRSGLSVFFLNMQRGLDILLSHRHADLDRVAVTGLSGGGWQTIILSSLDSRVRLAVPVAGHSALAQRVANYNSVGDLEQNPTDLVSIADYVHLNALMAPRPLLLIYNTKDNCCFVASTVKANTYEPVIPFYNQAGAAKLLKYYENEDPGTHNYDLDNRQQLYKFLNRHFFPDQERSAKEIPSQDELLSAEQLHVELPEGNATFYSLAAAAARNLPTKQAGAPAAQRRLLRRILRTSPMSTKVLRTKPHTIGEREMLMQAIEIGAEWVAPTARVSALKKSKRTRDTVVLFLSDQGFAAEAKRIEKLSTDSDVVAVDPLFFGHQKPQGSLWQNSMLLGVVGKRALGVQTSQVLAIARADDHPKVRIHAVGRRASLVARLADAIDDKQTIVAVTTTDEISSLHELLKPPAQYNQWPEAYCFGLLEQFDVKQLVQLAE
ncbi:MAG: acetylxylan esterase [Pirellulaceae bacterium]|nr:acetylxylan esterase [Pirellulaceae bacterium]MDP7016291.1 acetylxylan esterase [Pirellulaceae bacterium]